MHEEASSQSSTNVVLIVIAIIVGVLLLVVLACAGFGFFAYRAASQAVGPMLEAAAEWSDADTAAESFLSELAAGQIEAAYRSTSPAFQAGQTLEQFQAFVQQHPLLTQHTEVEMEDSDHNAAAGQMMLQYTLHGDGQTKVTFYMVKENGQWRVDKLTVP
jgi:hypothetical protein